MPLREGPNPFHTRNAAQDPSFHRIEPWYGFCKLKIQAHSQISLLSKNALQRSRKALIFTFLVYGNLHIQKHNKKSVLGYLDSWFCMRLLYHSYYWRPLPPYLRLQKTLCLYQDWNPWIFFDAFLVVGDFCWKVKGFSRFECSPVDACSSICPTLSSLHWMFVVIMSFSISSSLFSGSNSLFLLSFYLNFLILLIFFYILVYQLNLDNIYLHL